MSRSLNTPAKGDLMSVWFSATSAWRTEAEASSRLAWSASSWVGERKPRAASSADALWVSSLDLSLALAWSSVAWRASTLSLHRVWPAATVLPSRTGVKATTPAVSERTLTVRKAWVRPRMATRSGRVSAWTRLTWTVGVVSAAVAALAAWPWLALIRPLTRKYRANAATMPPTTR